MDCLYVRHYDAKSKPVFPRRRIFTWWSNNLFRLASEPASRKQVRLATWTSSFRHWWWRGSPVGGLICGAGVMFTSIPLEHSTVQQTSKVMKFNISTRACCFIYTIYCRKEAGGGSNRFRHFENTSRGTVFIWSFYFLFLFQRNERRYFSGNK